MRIYIRVNRMIKDIIKQRRQELHLTLEEIARYVGVSAATVSRWETGDIENMRRDKIKKLSEILRLSPSVVMGWEEPDLNHVKEEPAQYYLDQETADFAQELKDRPELKMLFSASRKATKEDIEMTIDILNRLTGGQK